MTTTVPLTVRATRWDLGWELHLDGEVVTQSRTLATAAQQVRDYLDTVEPDIDHSDQEITVVPDLDGLEEHAHEAREATQTARRATDAAAVQLRQVAAALRDADLPGADAAWLLQITPSRLSQLAPRRARSVQ